MRWLVLDEADRLLDLGFEKDLQDIIRIINERTKHREAARQSMLISATLTNEVQQLARLSLHDPVQVGMPSEEERLASDGAAPAERELSATHNQTPSTLSQHYVIVAAKLRLVTLIGCLKQRAEEGKVIVFVSSCASVDFHYWVLQLTIPSTTNKESQHMAVLSAPVFRLHGDLPQTERTRNYLEFSRANKGVLVCTNVAARGLDLPAVRHVIQYDPPEDAKEFVHQVGRTGRLGAIGDALLFLLPSEKAYVDVLAEHSVHPKHLSFQELLASLSESSSTNAEKAASHLQYFIEKAIEGQEEAGLLARNGFRSRIRAYATYPASIKAIFHVRRLHLGHIAKSFGLREQPSITGKKTQQEYKAPTKKRAASVAKDKGAVKKPKRVTLASLAASSQAKVSEFG